MYSTNEACLEAIYKLRFGGFDTCPNCHESTTISKVSKRRCYQCSSCKKQIYPTAGTVFDKTRIPLADILYIVYLFITTRNGVAAKEIERQLGISYEAAWKLGHRIRKLIGGHGESEAMIKGTVELDETYVGGKAANMHRKRRKLFAKTGNVNKTAVFGMLERGVGVRVKAMTTNYVTGKMLTPIIQAKIEKDTRVITDGHGAYNDLHKDFKHEVVNHEANEYVRGEDIHTNGIEGFWSQVKRTIGGTHIQVSKKYMQLYLDECAFRYNNVFKGEKMFDAILRNLPKGGNRISP